MFNRRASLLALALSVTAGCQLSSVEGLQGRWIGRIQCAVDSSDITLGIQVEGERLVGTAVTRTRNLNVDWTIEGAQQVRERDGRCADDSCSFDKDCASRGGGKCNAYGLCVPCTVRETWRQISISLIDADVASVDVELELERHSDYRMTGIAKSFCPDERLAVPRVWVNKDK